VLVLHVLVAHNHLLPFTFLVVAFLAALLTETFATKSISLKNSKVVFKTEFC